MKYLPLFIPILVVSCSKGFDQLDYRQVVAQAQTQLIDLNGTKIENDTSALPALRNKMQIMITRIDSLITLQPSNSIYLDSLKQLKFYFKLFGDSVINEGKRNYLRTVNSSKEENSLNKEENIPQEILGTWSNKTTDELGVQLEQETFRNDGSFSTLVETHLITPLDCRIESRGNFQVNEKTPNKIMVRMKNERFINNGTTITPEDRPELFTKDDYCLFWRIKNKWRFIETDKDGFSKVDSMTFVNQRFSFKRVTP